MRRLLLTLAFLLLSLGSYAQRPASVFVEGTLLTSPDRTPLAGLVVTLFPTDQSNPSSPYQALTSDGGYFSLYAPEGNYRIEVSFQGLRRVVRSVLTLEGKPVKLEPILFDLTKELPGVEVKAPALQVHYEGTNQVFTPSSLAPAKGGNLLDGLRFIPGVQLRGDEQLVLYGFSDLLVYVDDRPLRMSLEEQLTYLQSIPLDALASVELIREPSGRYAGVTSPVLNIRLRRSGASGLQGYSYGELVTRRSLSWLLGSRLTYTEGKTQTHLSYQLSEKRSEETTTLFEKVKDSLLLRPRRTHRFTLGTNIQLSPASTLGASLIGTLAKEHLENGWQSTSDSRTESLYGTLWHDWRTKGLTLKLTLEGSYASLSQDRLVRAEAVHYADTKRSGQVGLDASLPLGSLWSLDLGALGYGLSYRGSSPRGELHYELTESSLRGYLGLNYQTRPFSARLGLALQRDEQSRKQEQWKTKYPDASRGETLLLPYGSLRYHLGRHQDLTLGLSSSYRRPAFRDVVGGSHRTTEAIAREANLHLRTSYSYLLRLAYTYREAALLELSYSDTQHPIVDRIMLPIGGPMVVGLQGVNLDYSRYLRLLLSLPLPLIQSKELKWYATTYLAGQRQWDRGYLDGVLYSKAFTAGYLQHTHHLDLPGDWHLQLGVTAYSSLYYGLFEMSPQWWTEASVSRRLGSWRLSLSAYDLFNTNVARGDYRGYPYAFSFAREWYSPRLALGISYSWGRRDTKTRQGRERRLTDERLGSGASEGLRTER